MTGNGVSGGSTPLLLDTYTGAAAAYSLRKLRNAYSGSAIRVRRSSDSAEQDIGFTSGGLLDQSALTTFCGAGSGFVTTWYDQSGNSNNATQTTITAQPAIVTSGSVLLRSSKPSIDFDGSNDSLTMASQPFSGTGARDIYVVGGVDSTGTAQAILYVGGTLSGPLGGAYVVSSEIAVRVAGSIVYNDDLVDAALLQLSVLFAGSRTGDIAARLGGTALGVSANSDTAIDTVAGGAKEIGARPPAFYNGQLSELIIYAKDTSADVSGIESNQNIGWGL